MKLKFNLFLQIAAIASILTFTGCGGPEVTMCGCYEEGLKPDDGDKDYLKKCEDKISTMSRSEVREEFRKCANEKRSDKSIFEKGIDFCQCEKEVLKDKDDQDKGFIDKCKDRIKDMAFDDIKQALDDCKEGIPLPANRTKKKKTSIFKEIDPCDCMEEALKGKGDQDLDLVKNCEEQFKDMSLDDLQKAMKKCGD